MSNGIHPLKRIVGEARVHEDGSVVAWIPSNTPLIIQSLNADRMALRQEARYYFFVPNETFTLSPSRSETFQTCAACMGSISGKPADVFGPLNAFAGQASVLALRDGPGKVPRLGLDPRERTGVDYRRDIQPLLDRHCVGCHRGDHPAAGLSLTGEKTEYYTRSYESLLVLEDPASGWYGRKKYVSERDALAVESYLIEKLYGKELQAERSLTGDRPHPSPALLTRLRLAPPPLDEAGRLELVRWIDLGAPFLGAPEPGRGTR